ncbi:MAG TPA: hypothetical protein VGC99_01060 [Candidatus Tectomicrobia bacterium]
MADESPHAFPGAGGTPGGLAEFVIGLVMVAVGGYLVLNQVTVTTGFWGLWGYNAFGLTLVPLLGGIGWLFFDGRSAFGWVLVILGAAIILAGVIANLHIYFRPTSLFNTLIMLGLLVGGLGVIARSLRSH